MYVDFEDPHELVTSCQSLQLADDESLLICLGRESEPQLDEARRLLDGAGVRYFGGIFPALIHDGDVRERGAVVQRLRLLAKPAVVQIDGGKVVWEDPEPTVPVSPDKPTCLVLADFSCVAVSYLLDELFNRHANDVNYFGAGAGVGVRKPSPVLFSNAGRHTGCALVAYIGSKAEVHLRHGWTRNSEPVVATRTDGNVIKELNWEPSMTVYRDLVGDEVADSLDLGADVPSAKRFPFGIAREDLEDVVRDPLMSTEGGELVVLSDVPEHSVLHILHAEPDRLIAAAEDLAADFAPSGQASSCLVFDCYSRAKLLDADFVRELGVLEAGLRGKVAGCAVEGALALGEIASDGNRLPDFHNKTIAAAVFDVPR